MQDIKLNIEIAFISKLRIDYVRATFATLSSDYFSFLPAI
jgi:hypothetical protein